MLHICISGRDKLFQSRKKRVLTKKKKKQPKKTLTK